MYWNLKFKTSILTCLSLLWLIIEIIEIPAKSGKLLPESGLSISKLATSVTGQDFLQSSDGGQIRRKIKAKLKTERGKCIFHEVDGNNIMKS